MTTKVKSIFDYMDKVQDDKEPNKKPPVVDHVEYDDLGRMIKIYKTEQK